MIFLLCCSPPQLLHLFLSLSLKTVSLRVIWTVTSALRYIGFFIVLVYRKSPKMLTSARLHQISHVAEHLLNLLTLQASRGKLREDLTARKSYSRPIKTS